ncbi:MULTISPECIES: glycogen synthase [Shewanella]|uniref:glycogen synthase n=1 Tax=Shewanella TaxID=22 RepID=UPI00201B2776|nr:glycogen/starch synthase [Shewanella sp. 10B]
MVAAENGALKGAKVGGMADVIRDLPQALASVGIQADIIMPSYGFLTGLGAKLIHEFEVSFAGRQEPIKLYWLAQPKVPGANIYLLEHGLWQSSPGQIYSQGSSDRPFADDATKFALLCASVAKALVAGLVPMPELLHLHDWHTGCLAMLRALAPEYQALQSIECVFSIHNLALQGIRPLSHDTSSFAAWFPYLFAQLDEGQRAQIIDPRYPHCINPMRMGITLADKVHLVSPTYAKEVLLPSRPELGFFGGEGLEADLQRKAEQGRVLGILNGCEYPETLAQTSLERMGLTEFKALLSCIESALVQWQGGRSQVSGVDMIAFTRLQALWRQASAGEFPDFLLTSVGRLTDQKVLILRHILPSGLSVLETLLQQLPQTQPKALFVLLGSGDPEIGQFFQTLAAKYAHFVFLQGYHEELSQCLYQLGDLFLMPSSFEPCGISQMLAMRSGQPCLVHGVGGLRDTVEDNVDGFVFYGDDIKAQGEALLTKLGDALETFGAVDWMQFKRNAKARRFDWHSIALEYKKQLYNIL